MAGSAWPVTYRPTAPQPYRQGFQQPGRLPSPANDNRFAANDNFIDTARKLRRIAQRVPFGRKGTGFARAFTIMRRHPLWRLLDAIDLLDELAQLSKKKGGLEIAPSTGNGAPWKKVSECPVAGPPTHIYKGGYYNPSSGDACLSGQAKTTAFSEIGAAIERYWYSFSVYHDRGIDFSHPMEHHSTYTRDWLPDAGTPPAPGLIVTPDVWIWPEAAPALEPTVNPMAIPIGRPGPEKAPVPYRLIPYRVPNPWLSPNEQTIWGPVERAGPKTNANARFVVRPGQEVKVNPDAPPVPRAPPQRGTKERKFKIAVGGVTAKIINIATESIDFIDALFYALPAKARRGADTPDKKAMAIYRHYDELNMSKAIANLLVQQVQDRAYGTIGRASAEAARRAGRSTGFQLGPWDTAGGYYGNDFAWSHGAG